MVECIFAGTTNFMRENARIGSALYAKQTGLWPR